MPNEPRLLSQAEVDALEQNAFHGFNQGPTAVLNLAYTLRETQRLAGKYLAALDSYEATPDNYTDGTVRCDAVVYAKLALRAVLPKGKP